MGFLLLVLILALLLVLVLVFKVLLVLLVLLFGVVVRNFVFGAAVGVYVVGGDANVDF